MVRHDVAREYKLFLSPHPAVYGSRAHGYSQSLGNNVGGHGDHSCVVGALVGRPAGKMAAMATAGSSHRRSHGGRTIGR